MVDDKFGARQRLEKVAKFAQLVPGPGIDDDDAVDVTIGVARKFETGDAAIGIHERIAWRPNTGDDEVGRFPHRLEYAGQAHLRADTIGVRSDMRCNEKRFGLASEVDQRRPVNRHVGVLKMSGAWLFIPVRRSRE